MTGKELKQIDAWLDSDLSREDAAGLEAWLRADPAHLEMFAWASILHRHLRDTLRAQAMTEKAGEGDNSQQGPDLDSQFSSLPTLIPVAPVIIAPSSPGHYSLSTPFVGSWAFSCMVSAVFVCVMLLVFWAIEITPPPTYRRGAVAVGSVVRQAGDGVRRPDHRHGRLQVLGRQGHPAAVEQ